MTQTLRRTMHQNDTDMANKTYLARSGEIEHSKTPKTVSVEQDFMTRGWPGLCGSPQTPHSNILQTQLHCRLAQKNTYASSRSRKVEPRDLIGLLRVNGESAGPASPIVSPPMASFRRPLRLLRRRGDSSPSRSSSADAAAEEGGYRQVSGIGRGNDDSSGGAREEGSATAALSLPPLARGGGAGARRKPRHVSAFRERILEERRARKEGPRR